MLCDGVCQVGPPRSSPGSREVLDTPAPADATAMSRYFVCLNSHVGPFRAGLPKPDSFNLKLA